MATVNKRAYLPRSMVINGVDAGGMMQARITEGFDGILQTPADGLAIPLVDRITAFCRGTIITQDWVEIVNLLTGTVGTLVFYERKSGSAEASGFIKHTLTNPVIHRVRLSFTHRGYAMATADFECKAADETKTFTDMHAMTDAQNAPTYAAAARGIEITAALHGAVNIYHVTRFDFEIGMQLRKASHDGDVGYTAVDAEMGGISPSGSISFQDSGIATASLKAQQLTAAAMANLVLTIKQSQGAAAKTVTIANVLFGSFDSAPAADNSDYTEYSASLLVNNNTSTPLTLAGTNKILTIA